MLPFDHLNTQTLSPDLKLTDRAGAEGVARAQQHGLPMIGQLVAEFGDGGCLADPVDPGHQDHHWFGLAAVECPVLRRPHRFEFGLEILDDILAFGEGARFVVRLDPIDQFLCSRDTDIGFDETLLDLSDQLVVELPSREHRPQRGHKGLARFAQPALELVEGLAEDRHAQLSVVSTDRSPWLSTFLSTLSSSPLTNPGDSAVENCFASSTASLTLALGLGSSIMVIS